LSHACDLVWKGSELVKRSPSDRARGLAALFGHLESAFDCSLDHDLRGPEIEGLSDEVWVGMRELSRLYGTLTAGLRIAAEKGRATHLDQMTGSRMVDLLVAISLAEARLIGVLAAERARWSAEFLQG
jgi:hypothetical protein